MRPGPWPESLGQVPGPGPKILVRSGFSTFGGIGPRASENNGSWVEVEFYVDRPSSENLVPPIPTRDPIFSLAVDGGILDVPSLA